MTEAEQIALRKVHGNIHHTETFGTVDGPGIRYVFFLQGCPLRCLYCHNPDSLSSHGGTSWTAGQIADEALRYRSFIRSGGVTFSGGEPLIQPEFVTAAIRLLHHEGIASAIDTSGSENPQRAKAALDAADLILLDIKAFSPELCTTITGHGNHNAFATLDYCDSIGKPVWIRHVLLQGYTLDEAELAPLAKYLAAYSCVKRIELLPFHKLGEPKWAAIEKSYLLADTPATTREQVAWAKSFFTANGLKVQ